MDRANCFARRPLEHSETPSFVRVCHIDQMVGYPRALLRRRLGGADIHAAVKQARIRRDDFTTQILCKLDRNVGLSHGSGAQDDNQGEIRHA
jgi:hypothetical protein